MDLPGLYYDPEKKKYFAVQPDHIAQPGSKYSKSNVEKAKKDTLKRKRDEREAAKRARLIKPSRVSRFVHLTAPLAREIGNSPRISTSYRSGVSASYARGLEAYELEDVDYYQLTSNEGFVGTPRAWRNQFSIPCFDYDSATRGLLLGISSCSKVPPADKLCSIVGNPAPMVTETVASPRMSEDFYAYGRPRAIMAFNSDISSINITPSRSLVTTTRGFANRQAIIHLTSLIDPSMATHEAPLDSGASVMLQPPNLTTIWTSAPNPSPAFSYDSIAIGSSDGIILVDNGSGTWHWHTPFSTDSDVHALGWISPRVLAAGTRNGSIHLQDYRSNRSVVRLRHGTAVTGIRAAGNEHQIVIMGLEDTLHLYDLRFAKPALKNKGRMMRKSTATRPYMRFDYHNEGLHPIGMDVSPQLGLIAAGEEDAVKIYSLRDEKPLKSFKPFHHNPADLYLGQQQGVRCLRFVDAEDERRPRILASRGSQIVEMTW